MPSMTLEQAFALAQEHQAAGRLGEAESLCRQILSVQPNSPHVIQTLGIIACTQGRNAEGIAWFEQAARLDPTVSAYHANLGLALVAEGRMDEALHAWPELPYLRLLVTLDILKEWLLPDGGETTLKVNPSDCCPSMASSGLLLEMSPSDRISASSDEADDPCMSPICGT